MIIKQLRITNLRAFRKAEFDFCHGMNLLVGINGVGKSTVLDVIRILLSQMMPEISYSKNKRMNFTNADFTVNCDFLSASLSCQDGSSVFSYTLHKPREQYVVDQKNIDVVGKQTIPTPELPSWEANSKEKTNVKKLKKELCKNIQPFAIYFSPHRSLLDINTRKKASFLDLRVLAHVEVLSNLRYLNLQEFIDWWLACEKLAKEGIVREQASLKTLEQAIFEFLRCFNLRIDEKKKTLLIEKSGVTLDVKQLSDGERGVLALVLDLTKRLAQANPYLENPAKEGKAVVLIDELDLHLHPKWQRTIVDQLTRTFPNCQFIATTHSPQIISSVAPENVILLETGKPPVRPNQSLGMDTNWILKFLMETDERDSKYESELEKIAELIEARKYEIAQKRIDTLREKIGEFPELVRLQTRITRLSLLKK